MACIKETPPRLHHFGAVARRQNVYAVPAVIDVALSPHQT